MLFFEHKVGQLLLLLHCEVVIALVDAGLSRCLRGEKKIIFHDKYEKADWNISTQRIENE